MNTSSLFLSVSKQALSAWSFCIWIWFSSC
jgi:hypothetical protein